MKKRYNDLTGNQFGRLTILREENSTISSQGYEIRKWLYKCICGNEIVVREMHLKSGHTKSCGCLRSEKSSKHCLDMFSKPNKFEIYDTYVIGYSNNLSDYFIVDKDDYDEVKKYTWCKNSKGYFLNKNGELLHRYVMKEISNEAVIDHINHLKYDNRKANLRCCTQAQNSYNSKIGKNNTSGKTGVQWMKDRNKWRAMITYCGEKIYLGDYDNIDEAIHARINAENLHYKEYSYTNSIKLNSKD